MDTCNNTLTISTSSHADLDELFLDGPDPLHPPPHPQHQDAAQAEGDGQGKKRELHVRSASGKSNLTYFCLTSVPSHSLFTEKNAFAFTGN